MVSGISLIRKTEAYGYENRYSTTVYLWNTIYILEKWLWPSLMVVLASILEF